MDAMQLALNPVAWLWLKAGAKYKASENFAGGSWKIQVADALRPYGLSLDGRKNVFEAVDVFRPRWRFVPDPMFQLMDIVYPPANLLARGGDDCDGWAMAHAQAVEAVLKPQGWHAVVVSYYADPWWMSHHFAVGVDPDGGYWVLQPEPGLDQPDDQPTVFGPYGSLDDCVAQVTSWYQVRAEWWDVRTPMWEAMTKG